jgi:putative hydrolase of the HAD superfamily
MKIEAVTFDDYLTLRYAQVMQQDIIYPVYDKLNSKIGIEGPFFEWYRAIDKKARQERERNYSETSIIDIILTALKRINIQYDSLKKLVSDAFNEVIISQEYYWYPGAKETLRYLNQHGYKLGLISNTHWPFRERAREEYASLFDVITLSYEHGFVKPHPAIFQDTLTKMNAKAGQCIHVGDNPVADIEGAKKIGMKTIHICRESKQATKIEADYVIKHLDEVINIVKGLS